MEGDPAVLAEHVAEWADFLELEVHPAIEDDAAGAALEEGTRRVVCSLGRRLSGWQPGTRSNKLRVPVYFRVLRELRALLVLRSRTAD